MGRVSIIFADDHRMVRDFLRLAIQKQTRVCGSSARPRMAWNSWIN